MEKDFRTCPRVEIRLPVQYKYLENGKVFRALEAQAENIGAQGLAMRNDRAIEDGQKLLVTLFLPPEENGASVPPQAWTPEEGQPVVILSRVAWCRPRSGEAYTVGVEFLIPDQRHLRRLRRFLDEYRIDRPVRFEPMPEWDDENEP